MRGVKVDATVLDLVRLDDADARPEQQEGQQVEAGMDAGALDLLVGGPRRLQDQDRLGEDEDAGGLQQRVRAEQRQQRVQKH